MFKLFPSPLCTMSWNNFWRCILIFRYRTRAIISRGLYIFYPIFHCGLYCRAVSVTDNLCSKQFLGLKSAVYNQEHFQIKIGLQTVSRNISVFTTFRNCLQNVIWCGAEPIVKIAAIECKYKDQPKHFFCQSLNLRKVIDDL